VDPTEQTAGASQVGQNEYGLCLLATRDLDARVVVAHFEGDVVPYEEVPEDEVPYVLNLANGGWLIPSSTEAREANRSCDPNCMIDGQLDLVTVRPVPPARSSPTASCSTAVNTSAARRISFWDERWTFDCRCGSPNCVGRVDRYLFTREA
jgi:hypothetical protein